ncbi:peptide-methionine (R)-S-oxide reductase MsrB [Flexibacterium corallicola]|uniref:peptide-methionine (R)-S-oxide reductase MsrB n=1 Tax=Flexibacterium corallicola TaxID=3037259 RepID=UPI00286FA129|nr:peptide-methionine (R)-S-oxide reductase MsrB [Pseudovibrio sp. M1P-2-3]
MNNPKDKMNTQADKLKLSQDEWRERLSPEQFHVLREHGTERAFTGPFWDTFETGVYSCVACENKLFASNSKFDAGCGWPSFLATVSPDAVRELQDTSHGMVRTEIRCGKCDGHLGHVFPDGPKPTGLRYCMNGTAMHFTPSSKG